MCDVTLKRVPCAPSLPCATIGTRRRRLTLGQLFLQQRTMGGVSAAPLSRAEVDGVVAIAIASTSRRMPSAIVAKTDESTSDSALFPDLVSRDLGSSGRDGGWPRRQGELCNDRKLCVSRYTIFTLRRPRPVAPQVGRVPGPAENPPVEPSLRANGSAPPPTAVWRASCDQRQPRR